MQKGEFNIDTETPTVDLLKNDEEKTTLETLLDMLDDGSINEAEDKIFEIVAARDKANRHSMVLTVWLNCF